ncbi:MAG: hypothetical protein J6W15_04290, partial [Clostridia bacterium]|nr:hypothetical protein [Clostridia bacterium]
MKKIISVIAIALLLVSVMTVFAFAEKPFSINEKYRAAWNVKLEIPEGTVIADDLAGYDLLNMPAIKAG